MGKMPLSPVPVVRAGGWRGKPVLGQDSEAGDEESKSWVEFDTQLRF